MLDNSFGPWSQYYTQGIEKTWAAKVEKGNFYFRYVGKQPKFIFLHLLLNKFLNSRFKNIGWKYNLVRRQSMIAEGRFLNESQIQIDVEELWSNITTKTISAIDFALKNFDFEYVIRGNSSLYLDTRRLEQFLENNQDKVEYAGPVAGNKNFVSGWCIILSRRAARILVDNFQTKDRLLFDDEAIGIILRRSGVEMHEIEFQVFDRVPTAFEVREALDNGKWIWRFKDDSSGSRISIPAMKLVTETRVKYGYPL
jgi:hypothetical protein